jgi:RNA polymerase sigma-70 factor (ECF subfamily)
MARDRVSTYTHAGAADFRTTHWSVVLLSGQLLGLSSDEALEKLCRTYWPPIHVWLLRRGYSSHDAEDLTQSFFSHLLEKNRLQTLHPSKGKFRSFILASLKNYLTNEWDKNQALKRGGQFTFVSLNQEPDAAGSVPEPAHEVTPDKAFEQSWAMTLLATVLARLKEEYAAEGKSALFDALHGYLSGDRSGVPYAEMARQLHLTEGALKMGVLRLRRRFGDLLRVEIAHTVSTPSEIDEEIRCLFAAVSA